jgi:hypothetical protein
MAYQPETIVNTRELRVIIGQKSDDVTLLLDFIGYHSGYSDSYIPSQSATDKRLTNPNINDNTDQH